MTGPDDKSPQRPTPARLAREARLAEALRTNLRKRKALAKARGENENSPDTGVADPNPSRDR